MSLKSKNKIKPIVRLRKKTSPTLDRIQWIGSIVRFRKTSIDTNDDELKTKLQIKNAARKERGRSNETANRKPRVRPRGKEALSSSKIETANIEKEREKSVLAKVTDDGLGDLESDDQMQVYLRGHKAGFEKGIEAVAAAYQTQWDTIDTDCDEQARMPLDCLADVRAWLAGRQGSLNN